MKLILYSKKWGHCFFWICFFLSQFVMCALIVWHVLAQFDFAYPLAYRVLNLEEQIRVYAPKNRFKPNFSATLPKDHQQAFSDIVKAVQHNGVGLESIRYALPDGSIYTLLHQDEVIHLQDVAHLISQFYAVGIWASFLWFGLCFWLWLMKNKWQLKPPAIRLFLTGVGSIFLIGIGCVLVVGPKAIFYWAHTQVFPNNHPWFFYYEDSLMSTLMKAPDLFAFIAVLLLLLTIVLFWGITFLGYRFCWGNKKR
jgi:hypothetical protein